MKIVKKIVSNISYKYFETYLHELENNNLENAIEILYTIFDYGYSVIDILDMLYSFIKTTDIINENKKYLVLPILCKYITYFYNLHEDVIEVVLFTNEIHNVLYKT